MKQAPIQEELKTAFFGVFAITLKPCYSLKRHARGYTVADSPVRSSSAIIGVHNRPQQVGPSCLELEVLPGEIRIQIPYEAIQDYKRIGDLP